MQSVLTTSPQARDNKLTIEDMAGGTFTISNVSLPLDMLCLSAKTYTRCDLGRGLRIINGYSDHQFTPDR